ncbi:hypothetical protein LB450_08540 [Psychroflexus sp. CAK1W]|uniref:hypothetical protein n=1 Tax=Psychroflexus curvus TaxID=2873595 RepID=UPI001CC9E5F5|nr:hypothetical protein [Psychroflexus curvus]MBZ9628144.1 hypothetical protein [Psychroflexus curvus]
MKTQEIKTLIEELRSKTEVDEACWTTGGGATKYETELDGKTLIFDRRNNTDKDQVECYIKIGNYENVYAPDSEEFALISDFVTWL